MSPNWPTYAGIDHFVDRSPSGRVVVYVDPTLGQQGLQNAQDLVRDADRVASACESIFGTTGGLANVIIFAIAGATDGTGGASHNGCDFNSGSAIEVCASFGHSVRVSALFAAVLSECWMGGNLCGVSTGEALSRWCAAVIGNNALSDFATAPVWAQEGMPDYVSETNPTDQNADSVGCGMAFISWLMSKNYRLDQIAQTMVSLGPSGTLAQIYSNLTSGDPADALPSFMAAIHGLQGGVTNDDPFDSRIAATLALNPSGIEPIDPWPKAGSSGSKQPR
jgi:hypothetical protein